MKNNKLDQINSHKIKISIDTPLEKKLKILLNYLKMIILFFKKNLKMKIKYEKI